MVDSRKKAIGVLNLIDSRVSAPIAFFEYSKISSMKRDLLDLHFNLSLGCISAGAANKYLISARNHTDGVGLGIPTLETLARKIDAYHLALASLQRHTLECLETLDRSIHVIHALDINLRYFGPLSLARILQGEHQFVISSLAVTLPALHLHQGRFAILERGITQTVTEWEQRLTLEITIGTILHRIIEEIRKIVHTLIEGNRKLARWIHLSKENLGYSFTTPFTRIPCLKDCLGIFRQEPWRWHLPNS